MKSSVAKLEWYWNRLRLMSLGEILHRVGEQCKRTASRRRAYAWQDFDIAEGTCPCLPAGSLALEKLDQSVRDGWKKAYQTALRGELTLLGMTWPETLNGDRWHLDPVSGQMWPSDISCFSIPYRYAPDYGDVKYVWEFNRLQYLQPIAALGAMDQNEELQDFCISEIESWIDQNPPFCGVNWASGIELALRVISILIVLSFVSHQRISPEQARKIRACLNAHGAWLARYPSRFSSANNHLVAEAAGLFLLGLVFPDLEQAQSYESYGRQTLEAEINKQILDDGVGAEQSPTYLAFVIELYLLCVLVADRVGRPLSQNVNSRLLLAGSFLHWLTDDEGQQPRIGDDDEGRVIVSGSDVNGHYVSSVMSSLAAYLRNADIAPPVRQPHLRDVLFGYLTSDDFREGTKHFSCGGYTVARRRDDGRRIMLIMDHGPLGYLSLAAHGHADALAIWLHVDGVPVLCDAGTYLYHSGQEWRDYFRGTRAHNTLALENCDSSTIATTFAWSHKASCDVRQFSQTNNGFVLDASHDGYEKRHGFRHVRRLIASQPRSFVIEDKLEGQRARSAQVRIGFMTHPDVHVRESRGQWNFQFHDKDLVSMKGGTPLEPQLIHSVQSPVDGWCSQRFGSKKSCQQLVFRGTMTTDSPVRFEVCVIEEKLNNSVVL